MSKSEKFFHGSEERCPRTVDLGAYLLGGLTSEEAVDLRLHADQCPTCTEVLQELQPVADELGQVDLRPFAGIEIEQPSDGLRDRILAKALAEGPLPVVATERTGRRRIVDWKVAAAVGVVAFAVGAGSGYIAKPTPAPPKRAYWGTGTNEVTQRVDFASTATSGPRAWANVSSGPAGTYAALYTKGLNAGETYRWWFERSDGSRVALGSFVFPANQTKWVICPGGTSVERIELTAIGATDANGKDVLRADLPKPASS
jgi:Putative zinc-finger